MQIVYSYRDQPLLAASHLEQPYLYEEILSLLLPRAQWVCLPVMGLSPLAQESHEGKKVLSIVVYCLVVAPPPLALSLLSSSFRFCASLCSAPLLLSLHRGCRRVILKKGRSKIRQADRMKDRSKIGRQEGACLYCTVK